MYQAYINNEIIQIQKDKKRNPNIEIKWVKPDGTFPQYT